MVLSDSVSASNRRLIYTEHSVPWAALHTPAVLGDCDAGRTPGVRRAQVIGGNAAQADEYRAGKTGLLGFFVGQVMRLSAGKANPALVTQLVQERLGQ